MEMKIHVTWIYPTFFFGFSISPQFGYYVLGLGFVSFSIDRGMDDLLNRSEK